MERVIAIILGGGKGTRLYPLTKDRAKPAVPFAGKYRLIDIPMSNCINSGFKQIYILTQFNSASLHNHLASTYMFDSFSQGFVEILAAEQTFENTSWYEGTADAVRKNFQHFNTHEPEHYIILAGDQLYRMNIRDIFEHHLASDADITIAASPVDRARAANLGLIAANEDYRIVGFREKPGPDADIADWRIPSKLQSAITLSREHQSTPESPAEYLGSMGMYVFKAKALKRALDNGHPDFGKEIIPESIGRSHVSAFIFEDFWVDIGTISSFYETHINLASDTPSFDFYDEQMPIYTHRKHLPASRITNCAVYNSIVAEGCTIRGASILNSVIGIRSRIEQDSTLDGVVMMGSDFYETTEQIVEDRSEGVPKIGIGAGSAVRHAIIDTNARIGTGCSIGERPPLDGAYESYHVQDGIIIIPKNAVIPDGSRL